MPALAGASLAAASLARGNPMIRTLFKHRTTSWLRIAALALLAAACGQKGPLVLPEDAKDSDGAAVTSASATPAATADAAPAASNASGAEEQKSKTPTPNAY